MSITKDCVQMKNFERERTERVSEEQKEKKDQQERI